MKHTAAFAAPFPLRAGGKLLLMAPITLADHAFLDNVLADRFGVDEDGELEVTMGDLDGQTYLFGLAGFPFVLWVALHAHQPDLTIDDARSLARRVARKNPDHFLALVDKVVGFIFRPAAEQPARPWLRLMGGHNAPGSAKPLSAVQFGPIIESPTFREFGPGVVGGWTLDQFENKASGGKETGADAYREMSKAETDAFWRYCANPANRPEMLRNRAAEDEKERQKAERKAARIAARQARATPANDLTTDGVPTPPTHE